MTKNIYFIADNHANLNLAELFSQFVHVLREKKENNFGVVIEAGVMPEDYVKDDPKKTLLNSLNGRKNQINDQTKRHPKDLRPMLDIDGSLKMLPIQEIANRDLPIINKKIETINILQKNQVTAVNGGVNLLQVNPNMEKCIKDKLDQYDDVIVFIGGGHYQIFHSLMEKDLNINIKGFALGLYKESFSPFLACMHSFYSGYITSGKFLNESWIKHYQEIPDKQMLQQSLLEDDSKLLVSALPQNTSISVKKCGIFAVASVMATAAVAISRNYSYGQ